MLLRTDSASGRLRRKYAGLDVCWRKDSQKIAFTALTLVFTLGINLIQFHFSPKKLFLNILSSKFVEKFFFGFILWNQKFKTHKSQQHESRRLNATKGSDLFLEFALDCPGELVGLGPGCGDFNDDADLLLGTLAEDGRVFSHISSNMPGAMAGITAKTGGS